MTCPFYEFRYGGYYCLKKKQEIYSDLYQKYCKYYSYDDCPIYKDNYVDSSCYLTSACIYTKGLPDNCEELTILRNFRDSWLAKQTDGQDLINQYYLVAPKIVKCINLHPDKKEIYEIIYKSLVLPCVNLIKNHEYEAAKLLYLRETIKFQNQYLNT